MEFSQITADPEQWYGRNIAVRTGGLELAADSSLHREQCATGVRDIAVGADGSRYLLDQSGAISRQKERRGRHDRLWEPSDELSDPQSLAVSDGRLYVVDHGTVAVIPTDHPQVVDRIETGIDEIGAITAAGGRCYLLDSDTGAVRQLQADRSLQSVFESTATAIDMAVTQNGTVSVLEAVADHRAVTKQSSTGDLLDGEIYTGDRYRIRTQAADGEIDPDPYPLSPVETEQGVAVTPQRIATAAEAPLFVSGVTETDEPVLLQLDADSQRLEQRQELSGIARVLTTPTAGASTYAVVDERCVRIEPTERYTRGPEGGYRGVAYREFDAGSEAVQWHRLVVDHAQSAAGTQLRVAYRASDEPVGADEPLSELCELPRSVIEAAGIETVWELLSWTADELVAVSENKNETGNETGNETENETENETLTREQAESALDFAQSAVETGPEGHWETAESTADILCANATGRYLTVRLELVGSQRASPRIETVRASWPRQSYLQYLPEIYHDSGSNAVVEQFLSVFGTQFTDIERDIETITEYSDPHAVPAEALPWLAEWVGIEVPDEWPTAAVRKLIAAAADHQPTRGTKDGLRNMLALYLGHVEPAEKLPTDRLVPSRNTSVGMDVEMDRVGHGLWILEAQDLDTGRLSADTTAGWPVETPRSVVVYAGPFADHTHKQCVEAIIDRETPAHVDGRLVELDSAFRLGRNSFLGETSRLASRRFELGATRLGSTAALD